MSDIEIDYLVCKLRNLDLNRVRISRHLENKDITVDLTLIKAILKKPNLDKLILEYNETPNSNGVDKRILIRDDDIFNVTYNKNTEFEILKESNICFVISMVSFRIITLYYNFAEDRHDTLNLDRYDESIEIVK